VPARGRVVLHIGLPKTGSTTVQTFLSANRRRLRAHGIALVRRRIVPVERQLPVAFMTRPNRHTARVGVRTAADQAEVRAALARRLAAQLGDDRTLLLSSEHLSSMLGATDEVCRLAEFLAGVGADVSVIAVLRRVDHWVPSAYAEAAVSANPIPMDERFVHSRRAVADQCGLVERWTAGFGADAVRLLPVLQADKTEPLAMPLRLAAELGLPPAEVAAWPAPAHIERASLSALGVEMMRAIRPLLADPGLRPARDRQPLVAELARRYPGPPVALSPEAAAALAERGWIDNGIETRPQATRASSATLWPQWRAEPARPVSPVPEVTEDEVTELVEELRRSGVIRERSSSLGAKLRAAALRALR
jgi:hypothetical protein